MRFSSVVPVLRMVACILVAACSCVSPASAQERSASPAARFPADGLIVYVEFEGLTARSQGWRGTRFHGLLNETKLGDLFRDLARQAVTQMAQAADEEAGGRGKTDPRMLERIADALVHGGFAIGLYQVPGSEEPVPFMYGRDLAKNVDRKQLEDYLPKSDRTETRGGRSMRMRGNSGPVSWWEKDDVLIVDAALVDRAIAVADGKGANAASHPILAGIKGGSAAFVPIARAFADLAKIPLPPQAGDLGLNGIRHIEFLGGFEGDMIRNIARVVAPSPRKGLLSILDGPTFAADTMPPVHPAATSFTAVSIEPDAIFTKILAAVRSMDPASVRQVEGALGQFRNQTGVDLVEDVLKAIGPGMSFGAVPQRARGAGDNFAAFAVKDAAAFARTVEKLAPIVAGIANQFLQAQAGPNAGNVEIRREAGKAEWVVQLPGGLAPGLQQLSPRFRIEKNTLAFAFDPRTIDMIQQIAARRTPFAFRGDYAPIAQRLPKTMVYLGVQDPKSTFPALIAAIPQFLQGIDQAARADGNPPIPIRVNADLIPAPDAMAPYLSPSMMSVSVHPEGIKLDSTASVPSIDQPAVMGVAVALLLPAVQSAREAARRAQCINNHKQIALAMHNYADANGGFPPAAITGKDGEPLLSWRVALLPYLEEQALYDAIHKDEPWDSPHNKPLLARMPQVFACPSNSLAPGTTCYRAFAGDGAILEMDKPTPFRAITDGTSNTILFAESDEPVEWSRPEGLSVNAPGMAGLGSKHPGGLNAAFADGSVRFISSRVPAQTLKALVTKAGGEVVNP